MSSLSHQTAVYTHGEWHRLYDRLCASRPSPGMAPQTALRWIVDRAWIRGLALPLVGPPEDMVLTPAPAPPPR